MWLLSASGDLWNGRRRWLRPGTVHLVGRTTSPSSDGQSVNYIDHKSVSRKHLLIELDAVEPGDVAQLHKRTGLTLTDNSKVGTTVDGVKFSKSSKKIGVDSKEYKIILGTYGQELKVEWVPVVLTCTALTKKSGRSNVDLGDKKEQFSGIDVKLVTEYVQNETTHVLGKRWNAAHALQALVQARWVVSYDWLEQLKAAVTLPAEGVNGEPPKSPLESDFDAHWPQEIDHIAPSGDAPVPRPDSFLKPNADRAEIFQDFTFVFLSQSQHDSLLPVITSGLGKAVLWEYEQGHSQVEDLVSHVCDLAGSKKNSQFKLSQWSGRGGVVVVRIPQSHGAADYHGWQSEVDIKLDQRSIEQSEFLDPILTLDTSQLRRGLPESSQPAAEESLASPPRSASREATQRDQAMEDEPRRASAAQQPSTRTQEQEQPADEPVEVPDEQPADQPPVTKRKWGRRAVTKSRWEGFDDFDTSQFSRNVAASPSPEPSAAPEASQAASVQSMEVDGEPTQSSRQARKRPAPVEKEEAEEAEDMMDSMLQGQAALKRRKTEAAKKGEKNSFAQSFTDADRVATEKAEAKKKKKAEKMPDVKNALKERREAEEERRRLDEEALRQQLEGVDINEIQSKIQVEEMELPAREGAPRGDRREQIRGERWDPAWDGRANFKRFRKQVKGQRSEGTRVQRVIVGLEEAPRKGQGVGDEYWLTNSASTGRGKSKSQSQSQSQTVRGPQGPTGALAGPSGGHDDDDGEDNGHAFLRRRLQRSREEDADDNTERIDLDQIAGKPRDQGLAQLAAQSQTFGTESQRKAAGKRPAVSQAGGPAAKKARQTTTQTVGDDDDDGFGFKRRRRA